MSKHDKQVRRERKKRNSARRRQAVRHRTAALAGAVAIAAGTQAYAGPVRFDNPAHGEVGHFHWPFVALDITEAPENQPAIQDTPGALAHQTDSLIGGVPPNAPQVTVGGYGDYFVVGFNSGDLIDGTAVWAQEGYAYYPGYGSELPEGQATYLGVRINGPSYQYGWVGVVRTGGELDAFAWGYETEPGVPIAAGAPEPGTLALLAFGAAGACARRRRES